MNFNWNPVNDSDIVKLSQYIEATVDSEIWKDMGDTLCQDLLSHYPNAQKFVASFRVQFEQRLQHVKEAVNVQVTNRRLRVPNSITHTSSEPGPRREEIVNIEDSEDDEG